MKKKLWEVSGNGLHPKIEKFTVGNDYLIDKIFLPYDITASLAHTKMLHSIGVLTSQEYKQALKGFEDISAKVTGGNFEILPSQEDCHTAIEQYLTENYGDIGKKIHTGRSRNDQSLTMIRLFMKDVLSDSIKITKELMGTMDKKAGEFSVSMPGYTHMQRAMPTTINTWVLSYKDALEDQSKILEALIPIFDQSPLGSAAGFGIESFSNDKKLSASYMGFSKVQENPMYCGISRGLFEHNLLTALGNILMVIGRMNNDLLLFTTQEFGFVYLPDTMTTGSSIMPNKRNYDVCELIRAKISVFFGYSDQMKNLYTHLMGGYQRDLQMTKSILLNGYEVWKDIAEVFNLIIENLGINEEKLAKAMTSDLFATEEVYKLVSEGMAFRDAYMQIKTKLH
ncbi:MAG: argininosuccinate lyase [Candidatus Gracilibacteria bacterium]|nr:argininosuccinate lyase [Candidatus Gracilibacteria bacterium]